MHERFTDGEVTGLQVRLQPSRAKFSTPGRSAPGMPLSLMLANRSGCRMHVPKLGFVTKTVRSMHQANP